MDTEGFYTKVFVREDDSRELYQTLQVVRLRMRAKRLLGLAKLGLKAEQGLLVPIELLNEAVQGAGAEVVPEKIALHNAKSVPEPVDAEGLGDLVDLIGGSVTEG